MVKSTLATSPAVVIWTTWIKSIHHKHKSNNPQQAWSSAIGFLEHSYQFSPFHRCSSLISNDILGLVVVVNASMNINSILHTTQHNLVFSFSHEIKLFQFKTFISPSKASTQIEMRRVYQQTSKPSNHKYYKTTNRTTDYCFANCNHQ